MKISALLGHAMKVDLECKRAVRRLGKKAFALKAEANAEESPEKARIKEILANHLNEAAGQLRYNPTKLKDIYDNDMQKSDARVFADAVLHKGMRVDGIYENIVGMNGARLLVTSAEYDPLEKGWRFLLDPEIADADFVVFLCRSFGEISRDYILPVDLVEKSFSVNYEYTPKVGEAFIPLYDADWMEFRDRL